MNSLRYILTIAANERLMLYRTAKFWVLGGLGIIFMIFFLVLVTLVTFLDNNPPGEFLLDGTDSYLALFFFSFIQIILIVFVAVDFRKLEEKWRLDEVMFSKPMTTANWVLGKYFGVVSSILYLNLFLIFLAIVARTIKYFALGASFNILPFITYFLVVTFPSILFMVALVFFLVSLVRIPAVAMLLSIGYVAGILFYFQDKFYGMFDYGCFLAQIFYSDLIGFGNLEPILWQRLFFITITIVLLAFTILLYPRLRQSNFSFRLTLASSVLFSLLAFSVGNKIVNQHQAIEEKRLADYEYQSQWISEPTCKVRHYDFDIIHGDKTTPLQVNLKMVITNPNYELLRRLVFALNGNLKVSKVNWHDGEEIDFIQKHQLLELDLQNKPLLSSQTDTIEVQYSGNVDGDLFMLDRIAETKGIIEKSNGPWRQPNISAWIDENFAVLPAESGWYPTPGAAAGYPFHAPKDKNFATARIRVETDPHLRTISQGIIAVDTTNHGKRQTTFLVEDPLPGYSLHIGNYQVLSHQFKQTKLEFYYYKNHLLDFEEFEDVADTCLDAIERMLEIFEEVSGIPYPYPRLAIVEVPLHLQVYINRFGLNNILIQPGIIMLSEVNLASKRIGVAIKRKTKRARKDGQDDSPTKVKRDVFIDLVLETFIPQSSWRTEGSIRSPMKNYLHFGIDIKDPILARALDLQLYEEADRRINDAFYPDRYFLSLSANDRMRNFDGERAIKRKYDLEIDSLITALLQKPLSQFSPEIDGKLFRAAVDFKAPPVLQMLQAKTDEDIYYQALQKLVEQYRYQPVTREDFIDILQETSNQDIKGFFDQWFEQTSLPGYRITRADAEKIDSGQMKISYQVTTRVQNGERGDGFVRLVCYTKNDKIRRNIQLGSFQEKELKFIVPDEPQRISVIPYFSRNRGSIQKQITIASRISRKSPIDTSYVVSSLEDAGSIIIDDRDDGFFTPTSAEKKYFRPPSKGKSWWSWTSPIAYGKYYFGLHAKRGGSGQYPARWEMQPPRSGDYELSFFVKMGSTWWRRNISRKFQVAVTCADGTFPIDFQPEDTVEGWFPLGRYRLVEGEPAVVELSDKGNGYIIADAIRWEFIE